MPTLAWLKRVAKSHASGSHDYCSTDTCDEARRLAEEFEPEPDAPDFIDELQERVKAKLTAVYPAPPPREPEPEPEPAPEPEYRPDPEREAERRKAEAAAAFHQLIVEAYVKFGAMHSTGCGHTQPAMWRLPCAECAKVCAEAEEQGLTAAYVKINTTDTAPRRVRFIRRDLNDA